MQAIAVTQGIELPVKYHSRLRFGLRKLALE